jgi:hypothetical protein
MRDVKNGKDDAQLFQPFREGSNASMILAMGIQALPIVWDAAAVAPNKHQLNKLIRRENCPHLIAPLFDHLRELLNPV